MQGGDGPSSATIAAAFFRQTVHQWRPKPSKPDNHCFDCLPGCAVAASMAGVKAPGETASGRRRKRYTQDDLRRKDTWPSL